MSASFPVVIVSWVRYYLACAVAQFGHPSGHYQVACAVAQLIDPTVLTNNDHCALMWETVPNTDIVAQKFVADHCRRQPSDVVLDCIETKPKRD